MFGVRKQPSLLSMMFVSMMFAARSRQRSALPSSTLSQACQERARTVPAAPLLLGVPRIRATYELGGKLDASGRSWSKEKNWLPIGSPQAGPKVAAILSVGESCRRLQVPVRDYFSTILQGLADLPIRCHPDLTPAVRVARAFTNSSDLGIRVK